MNQLIITFFIAVTSIQFAVAQPAQLMIKHDDMGHYVEHSVTAKEGFFSIGRIYNVHPKALAEYNSLDMYKGLAIGQVLRVPLTDTNFSQKTNKGTPVYYKVGKEEGLLKVSNANRKVTMQSIRDWNKLSNDNLKPGTNLVVGFLIAGQPTATAVTPPKEITKPTEEVKQQVIAETIPPNTIVKEEPKKADPPKEEIKKAEVATENKQPGNGNMSVQGYFKTSFDQQVKEKPVSKTQTVTSGIFKTSSGWADAKFYLLIDKVASGTIVRIINPDNNRMIYAKVLGEMNGIRQNQGFDIRMSNAAASTLGISETEKFIVKINY